MIVTVLVGAGLGLGLWLVATGARPSRPSLAELLAALQPAAGPGIAVRPVVDTAPDGWAARAGRPAARLVAAGSLIGGATRRDLAVLGRPVAAHTGEKVTAAAVGLLLVPAVSVVFTVAGVGVGWSLPVGGSLLLAAAGFLTPDLGVRVEARRYRADAGHALSAFLDLTVIGLAGGAGVEQALDDAATAGDGPLFTQLRRALDTARLARVPPWEPLGRLGGELGLAALSEMAAAVSLAGTEGATIRASLAAKAVSARTHALTAAEAEAVAATERLSVPVVVLFAGFLVFIGYPAVIHVLTGL
ncbi:type II secretion system F family protein [Frankia sp. CiP3]|uniref:type II secretion system F family protein n=1 Tax=Frankia sp. CiP3 TaxID=2880971 RepID=UPI001EF5FBB3|nr:type II secretion system F family protein [Frankia sp. CiP3]